MGGPRETEDPLPPGRTMMVDSMAIVTVQDGPSLEPGEIIAPAVGTDRTDKDFHNNYQDPEAFLRAGGRRGGTPPGPGNCCRSEEHTSELQSHLNLLCLLLL